MNRRYRENIYRFILKKRRKKNKWLKKEIEIFQVTANQIFTVWETSVDSVLYYNNSRLF